MSQGEQFLVTFAFQAPVLNRLAKLAELAVLAVLQLAVELLSKVHRGGVKEAKHAVLTTYKGYCW